MVTGRTVPGAERLLAVDVGNTNTVLGLYDGAELLRHWRLTSRRDATSDEIALSVEGLLRTVPEGLPPDDVIVASVVPSLRFPMRQAFRQLFDRDPLFVEPGIKTGMPILYESPQEVGADRIVNAVAAHARLGGPCIVVDFGTATTFDVVSREGEYVGGALMTGIEISLEALSERGARLPKVDLAPPKSVIGKNTIDAIRSGVVFGYAGAIDAILRRLYGELGQRADVVATGGLAGLVVPYTEELKLIDDLLTLTGLRLLHERNS
jgi:type III pantothenate kinase